MYCSATPTCMWYTQMSYFLCSTNTTHKTRSNIAAHYDLSNELFKTFLDHDYMLYSSGLFHADMGRYVIFVI